MKKFIVLIVLLLLGAFANAQDTDTYKYDYVRNFDRYGDVITEGRVSTLITVSPKFYSVDIKDVGVKTFFRPCSLDATFNPKFTRYQSRGFYCDEMKELLIDVPIDNFSKGSVSYRKAHIYVLTSTDVYLDSAMKQFVTSIIDITSPVGEVVRFTNE